MSLATTRRDARTLDFATLDEMRRLAISRIKSGESQFDVARNLKVRPKSVWKWVEAHRRRRDEGLASTKATAVNPKLRRKKLTRVISNKNSDRAGVLGKERFLGMGKAVANAIA